MNFVESTWPEKGMYMSVLINQFGPPTFCLYFAFTGINFRGMLHHVCDVVYDENMSGPIRPVGVQID